MFDGIGPQPTDRHEVKHRAGPDRKPGNEPKAPPPPGRGLRQEYAARGRLAPVPACTLAGMLIFAFLGSIALANWMVVALDPVPVGFGLYAPAGVYVVAVVLVLRDLVQRFSGARGVLIAAVGGIALSALLAGSQVALASGLAFVASFVTDTIVYTLVSRHTRRLATAALISGLVSIVPDTFVFLSLAGLLQYWPGQLVGKAVGTVVAALLLWPLDRALERRRLEREALARVLPHTSQP